MLAVVNVPSMLHLRKRLITAIAALASCVVLLTFVTAARLSAEEKSPSRRWEQTIEQFEAADRKSPPPEGAILFIGSSSIVRWKTLAEDFSEHKVINRGFGGSQIADATYFADRIVIPYKPRLIVLRSGSNDIAAGKSPEQVLADFQAFVAAVRAGLPKVRIVFLSSNPSLLRWANFPKETKANELIRAYCTPERNLDYINIVPGMLGPDGKPRPELYAADRLHPNAEAYKLWAAELRPHLQAGSGMPRVPGIIIDHWPTKSGQYVGSPSIAVLPGGDYVASHDLFGPKSTEMRSAVTRVFHSMDRGETWRHLTDIQGAFWSSLFVHGGQLYLLGTNRHYGAVVIRRSDDGGRTWSQPKDSNSGLLFDGNQYHCAPVPVVVAHGRIWRAIEDTMGPGGWGTSFRARMISAPQNADLLKASSWTMTNPLARNSEWLGGRFGGWLEGNAVVARDGEILDILRVDSPAGEEKAAIVRISADGRTASFDPATGFIDFPGGCKKFTIRFDLVSKLYWSLTNFVPPEERRGRTERTRNTVALVSSPDLRAWTVRAIVLHHPDPKKHGFQYLDWQFDGDDLIAVSRTAFDDAEGGAHNQHDANYLTFHRIRGFRER